MRKLLLLLLIAVCTFTAAAQTGEILYNGIHLPAVWPPRDTPVSREPMAVPYLATPPDLIPIDIGRQLFVDDFLIQETTLKRVNHAATYFPENPVMKPDRPWETENSSSQYKPAPTAMVFSDGVWFDPKDHLFKMWYMGGYTLCTCYATSKDGIHWDKPALDVVSGTNEVGAVKRDSSTVWLDAYEKDPARRFKLFFYGFNGTGRGSLSIHFSPDGIHWGDKIAESGPVGDRTTVFYNPFRGVWVYSIREDLPGLGRCRRYWEGKDVLAAAKWNKDEPPFWTGADTLDLPRSDIKTPCELYTLDAAAYESVMIGLFSIWRGQPNDRAKPNEICVGFTRDGFHWSRPTHDAFIPVSEKQGDWNWANIQSAGGCCLVISDKLYFYVSGRAGVRGSPASGTCTTGLATLRRDGFASMEAGETEGTLLTRAIKFAGTHLFVNVNDPNGELRVEAIGLDNNPVTPFTAENCTPIEIDSTHTEVHWNGATDLAALAGKPIRFRFHLKNGKLYSFWVSPEPTGASHGYVAAGGPDFTEPTDTVGK